MAERLRAIAGVNIAHAPVNLRIDRIAHADRKHGGGSSIEIERGKKPGQIPIEPSDFDQIFKVVAEFDDAALTLPRRMLQKMENKPDFIPQKSDFGLNFVKKEEDMLIVVTTTPNRHGVMDVQTLFKKEGKGVSAAAYLNEVLGTTSNNAADRALAQERVNQIFRKRQSLDAVKALSKKQEMGHVDGSILEEIIDFGRSVYRTGMNFADWAAKMIETLGDRVNELLKEIWSRIYGGRPAETGGEPAEASGEAGRGSKGVSSQEVAQVRGWTQDILKGWGSKLDVVVHDSAEGIADARLREAVQEQGGNVEAFFDPKDGRIHLLADRVGSKADAERLLRHEGIHWAVRGSMQEEYQGILNGVRQRISREKWDALSKSYAESPDHVRVEEYLAYLGQTNPRATAWQSFVYEVKQMLRNAFGKDFEVTDGDVLAFLQKANRKVEREENTLIHQFLNSSLPNETATEDAKGRLFFSKQTTQSLRELINRFKEELSAAELTLEQQGIADVVGGKVEYATIRKNDLSLLSDIVTGHYGFGVKHIIVHHYSGKRGAVTAMEIVEMGKVIRNGLVKEEEGKRVYEWHDADGVRFRVVVSNKGEKVISFYSNRK